MTLAQAISAAGMTPPRAFPPGKWVRFPGIGKGRSNRAGWCRVITPTLAIYGDWSTGLSKVWRDDTHRDDAHSKRLLAEARERERRFAAEQRAKQASVAREAEELVRRAVPMTHPYLARKGFPTEVGLVRDGKLLVPVRDAADYGRILSVQMIAEDGQKRFLPGGRTRGGVYRLGVPPKRARRIVLCEGYATGLSIMAALERLPGPHAVVVCFSARNLEIVAESAPAAVVAADHDESRTGEESARRTGLPWVMPPEIGDFNDLHCARGLHAVTQALREVIQKKEAA